MTMETYLEERRYTYCPKKDIRCNQARNKGGKCTCQYYVTKGIAEHGTNVNNLKCCPMQLDNVKQWARK